MKRSRQAFTLVELLVVIAIMGMMMAILLPAIQQVRETARRTSCAATLRDIGLAMASHLDLQQKFPPGMKVNKYKPDSNGKMLWHSVWIYLMPYREERNLFDRYDFSSSNITAGDLRNVDVLATSLPSFLCPTDDSKRMVEGEHGTEWARSNYAVCFGTKTVMRSEDNAETDGPFRMDKSRRHRDFYNGVTKTAFASEVIAGTDDNWGAEGPVDMRGVWAFPVPGASVYMHRFPPNNYQPDPESTGDDGGDAMLAEWCVDSRPDTNELACQAIQDDMHLMHAAARSRHINGVNVMFGGARVEYVTNLVDLHVWKNYGRIDPLEDEEDAEDDLP